MTYRLLFAAPAVAALAIAGCGPSGRVKEETIEVKENSALDQSKKYLEAYSKGQPLGSEASTYDSLVEEVRKTDAARADVLQKGFADIRKAPKGGVPAKAKEVLAQLAPRMTGD
jgi:hypothetical protein